MRFALLSGKYLYRDKYNKHMENIYTMDFFYDLLYIMFIVGLVVFVSLYFVDAGYGKMRSEKWGPTMSNKAGWFLMEVPVFLVMLYLYFVDAVCPEK